MSRHQNRMKNHVANLGLSPEEAEAYANMSPMERQALRREKQSHKDFELEQFKIDLKIARIVAEERGLRPKGTSEDIDAMTYGQGGLCLKEKKTCKK